MTQQKRNELKTLQEKVNYKIEVLQDKSKKTFGVVVPMIQIAYDLNTVNLGGQAIINHRESKYKIRLHPAALLKYNNDYIEDIVVHEYAHLVQRILYPMSKPHGIEWKSVMRGLGAEPTRCHKYDLREALAEVGTSSEIKGRRLKTFTYTCGCMEYKLTSIRHNRVVSGKQTYSCRKCRQTLVKK